MASSLAAKQRQSGKRVAGLRHVQMSTVGVFLARTANEVYMQYIEWRITAKTRQMCHQPILAQLPVGSWQRIGGACV